MAYSIQRVINHHISGNDVTLTSFPVNIWQVSQVCLHVEFKIHMPKDTESFVLIVPLVWQILREKNDGRGALDNLPQWGAG